MKIHLKKIVIILIAGLLVSGCSDPTVETFTQPIPTPIDLGQAQYPIKEGEDKFDKIKEFFAQTPTQVKPTQTKVQTASNNDYPKREVTPDTEKNIKEVVITTDKGEIKFKTDESKSPKSIANLGEKIQSDFYRNLTFHRVEDWVVQGGDPTGTGRGGGFMPTEISDQPFKEGSVGYARGGDVNISNDAQFFICTADCSFLTGSYTYLGEVTKGLEVARAIAVGDKIIEMKIN